jgi:DNA-binding GntR family transcriptional regulator
MHQQALGAAKRNDEEEYSRLNEALHRAIYSAARNKNLEAVTLGLRQRLAPFRSKAFFHVDNRMRSSSQEHDALVRAIVGGNADAAGEAMRNHAASAAMNVMEYFRKAERRGDVAFNNRVYKNSKVVHKFG